MKKYLLNSLYVLAFAASSFNAQAGDIQAGKLKAKLCFACHGEQGKAILPQYPNLAGQNDAYLKAALKAYQDGKRQDLMMVPLAKALSAQDIDNISAYYSSIK